MSRQETWIEGRLGFNDQNGRYGLLVSDIWEHTGLHCGETLEILADGTWIPTRMEMSIDGEWYLVDTGIRGGMIEYVRARIRK